MVYAKSMYSLYRHYDSQNRLLYIGCTFNVMQRHLLHTQKTKWFQDVVKIEITKVSDDKKIALTKEREAILKERPIFNIYHQEKVKKTKTSVVKPGRKRQIIKPVKIKLTSSSTKRREYLSQFIGRRKQIAEMLQRGMTYADIARELGVTRQAIRQAALK